MEITFTEPGPVHSSQDVIDTLVKECGIKHVLHEVAEAVQYQAETQSAIGNTERSDTLIRAWKQIDDLRERIQV